MPTISQDLTKSNYSLQKKNPHKESVVIIIKEIPSKREKESTKMVSVYSTPGIILS